MKKNLQDDRLIGIALALAALIAYLATLSTSVAGEDCGELAAALSSLGITHPTGYPLFTVLGYLFAHLPFPARVIWKLNLLMALSCSAAVFLFYRLFLALLSSRTWEALASYPHPSERPMNPPPGTGTEVENLSPRRLAAAGAALSLAFSQTFWSQAVSLEVYALHQVFLALVLWLFLRALSGGRALLPREENRRWRAFALALGFSFTHHMMTVLLAPACLYLYFAVHGFGRKAWTHIAKGAPFFLFPLSLYLYLPLRSAQNPLMNWGDPSNWADFWRHVTGSQYRTQMLPSAEVAARKLQEFSAAFPRDFGYAPLLFSLVGLWYLFRRSKRLFIFSLLIFLCCLGYSFNYDFKDPNYYAHAFAAAGIFAAFGMFALLKYAPAGGIRFSAASLVPLAILFSLGYHRPLADKSADYAVEDYARNMFGGLDSNALIVTGEYNYFTSAAFYLQEVEQLRRDVAVVDNQLLAFPWYYKQLERRYPGLLRGSGTESGSFRIRLDELSHRGGGEWDETFRAFVNNAGSAIVTENYRVRPVYVTRDADLGITRGFGAIPAGLAMRLYLGSPPVPRTPFEFAFRPFSQNNPESGDIKRLYSNAYLNQGIYRYMLKDTGTAILFIRKAVNMAPDFQPAKQWAQRLGTGFP